MSDDRFDKRFASELEGSTRLVAMREIWKMVVALEKPVVIVETGCVRLEGNWIGDGQSTVMFDWMVSELGGMLTSIDIDPKAIETALRLAPNCHGIVGDSVEVLGELRNKEHIDLLFLDSFDWDGTMAAPTHHANELGQCWDQLKPGCIIAIDDCRTIDSGKHQMVRQILMASGIRPLLQTYISIWQKPANAPSWASMLKVVMPQVETATVKQDLELRG